MADPIETQILKEIQARLEMISRRDGYRTDLGQRVYRGPINIDDADLAIPMTCVITSGITAVDQKGNKQQSAIGINIESHHRITYEHGEDQAMDMLRDIYDAIEQIPGSANVQTNAIKRQPVFDSASVEYPNGPREIVSTVASYQIIYVRDYGKTTS